MKNNMQKLNYSRELLMINRDYHQASLNKAIISLATGYDNKYYRKQVLFYQNTVNDLTEALRILNQYH